MTSFEIGAPPRKRLRSFTQDPLTVAVIAGFFGYLALLFLIWKAILIWTPDQIGMQVLGHNLHVGALHHHIYSHAMEALGLFPALFVLDLAFAGWEDSSMRYLLSGSPSAMTDLSLWLMAESRLWTVLVFVMSFGVGLIGGDFIHDWIARATGVNLTTDGWPLWIEFPVLFLVFSFFDYWNHRLDHTPLFWPLHRFHHAAQEFTILTASRVHPALFTSVVSVVGPAAVIGTPPQDMLALIVVAGILRNLIHSRIDTNFGWVGRWLLQSPNHHRLHHVLDISVVPTGHFSLCPLWDHMFGTWRGEADQTLPIGIDDAPYRHGFWVQHDMWRDYMDFWKGWLPRRKAVAQPEPSTSS